MVKVIVWTVEKSRYSLIYVLTTHALYLFSFVHTYMFFFCILCITIMMTLFNFCEPSPRRCMYYICIFCTSYANAAPNRALCLLLINVETVCSSHNLQFNPRKTERLGKWGDRKNLTYYCDHHIDICVRVCHFGSNCFF